MIINRQINILGLLLNFLSKWSFGSIHKNRSNHLSFPPNTHMACHTAYNKIQFLGLGLQNPTWSHLWNPISGALLLPCGTTLLPTQPYPAPLSPSDGFLPSNPSTFNSKLISPSHPVNDLQLLVQALAVRQHCLVVVVIVFYWAYYYLSVLEAVEDKNNAWAAVTLLSLTVGSAT